MPRVTGIQLTSTTKATIIESLALAFERGEIKTLPDPVLAGELLAYEAERLPSGMIRYSAPAGMHDDMVIALALAWEGTGRQTPPSIPGHDPFAVAARSGPAIELRRGRFEKVSSKTKHTQWGFS